MNKTMTWLLCSSLLGLAGELSAKPLYEVVSAEIDSDDKVEDVIAELKGKDNGTALPTGDGRFCIEFDGQKTDFGKLAGMNCVIRLVGNEQGLVAGYGTAGGIQRIIDYWYRMYFRTFVANVRNNFMRYQYPTRSAFVYDGQRVVQVPGLGGTDTLVYAMNAAGHLVGRSENRKGDHHAFVHRDGHSIDLGTLGGNCSQARAIID